MSCQLNAVQHSNIKLAKKFLQNGKLEYLGRVEAKKVTFTNTKKFQKVKLTNTVMPIFF
jgi:hypothetical protein